MTERLMQVTATPDFYEGVTLSLLEDRGLRAEVLALRAAQGAYGDIEDKQNAAMRNEKLHVGVALTLENGKVISVHNNKNAHGEDRMIDVLLEYFDTIPAGEKLPRIAALALSGTNAHENLHDPDSVAPMQISNLSMPKGTPTPCYKCMYLIQRAVTTIATSRTSVDGIVPSHNFPVLVELKGGAILRTDYHTVPKFKFPGSEKAKTLAEIRSAK
jgi:hypothetical protein